MGVVNIEVFASCSGEFVFYVGKLLFQFGDFGLEGFNFLFSLTDTAFALLLALIVHLALAGRLFRIFGFNYGRSAIFDFELL